MLHGMLRNLVLLFLLIVSPPVLAKEKALLLVDGNRQVSVSVQELRQQAYVEFTIYAPFRRKEIAMRGIYLDDVLQKYLSRLPTKLRFTATDEYQITFNDWKKKHWVLITHEDGKALNLRQRGPLRLVEINNEGKDVNNLRDFNDWVWMLIKIEAL